MSLSEAGKAVEPTVFFTPRKSGRRRRDETVWTLVQGEFWHPFSSVVFLISLALDRCFS